MGSQERKFRESPIPELDDNWWASVMADEERHLGMPAEKAAPRPVEPSRSISPDWTRAKTLYQSDEIIELTVTGYNRGGLLVEGSGIMGFVPFSHLVDLVGRSDTVNREQSLAAYVGRVLRLKVIECVPEDGRIVFSERAALSQAGRRKELFHALQVGQRMSGEVTNITDFGVFIDLGGVEGLIHISELSWGRVAHPSQIVQLGQRLEVQVLEVMPERCRVALSLKRLFPNPWTTAERDLLVDSVVEAVVTSIVPFGAFARLDAGLEGLIHTSEIPLPEGGSPHDVLEEGQEVRVRVLHVDAAHQRLGLSLRLDA